MDERMTTLFKKDSKGKLRIWTIRTDGAEIIEDYGLVEGKQARNNKVCTPKNVGKSNETTPEQQAKLEAKSRVNKKLDEGYKPTINEAMLERIVLPMLAKSYDKHSKKVTYPCFTQPKLDGMRALFVNGKLISRKGKQIDTMGHILLQLKDMGLILDGELYAHGETFQQNMKWIKKYREGESEKVCYHVYDIVDESMSFEQRYDLLRDTVRRLKTDSILLTPCDTVYDYDQIVDKHKTHVEFGFEGTMIRWGEDGYKIDGRSANLLKFKDFQDVTATVFDVVPQDARPTHGMLWCENEMGRFKATPKVSHSEREQMLLNKQDYIGQTAEIRYFEETEDGLPRFPVCVGFRLDK